MIYNLIKDRIMVLIYIKILKHVNTREKLVIAGKEDHFIDPKLFHEEYDLLTNARSLSFQLYTNQDDAGSHCNVGNMQLTMDTMINWILLMNSKENHDKKE
ncbi:hypothetical protein PIROE2DRAFT_9403 [Piromyces sp. E2]|nr:hypothetical protein PIROE2DRAFT_9403 [Piromyces sp. E2]|eukprot:OUM63946.1 hypothetical protein PIROE2DRAFT_9403 [Piromyces sp. E2]